MTIRRVRYGLNDKAYRDAPGLSHSQSKQLQKTPYHFKRLSEPRPDDVAKVSTPQMFMGTLTHAALLEPATFDARYVVGPDVSKNSNEWKRFAAELVERKAEPITQVQRDQAFAMAASVAQLPDVAALLGPGHQPEVSIWWNCPRTGVLCKGRLDLVRAFATPDEPEGILGVLDLKSTDDASPESFAKSIANYSYHTQQDWYAEGVEIVLARPVRSFVFAVVEREFPYAARSYYLDAKSLALAREMNDEVRRLYAHCKKTGQWPGYPTEAQEISLPPWYLKQKGMTYE